MLSRLLRTYLKRYKTELALLVFFQVCQALATLFLPSITADIIDHGVLAHNSPYIWHRGGLMLAVTVFQVVANGVAIYFGAKIAMAFGRDVRDGVFQQVSGYSSREVGQFGAPSLITRTTNDVQQVQMFTVMAFTLFVAAPIMCVGGIVMALREDVGLSWSLTVAVPALVIGVGLIVWRMVPQFRIMQEKVDGVNRVLREQITGIRVVRAFVREPAERRRFEAVNHELTDTGLRAGHLQALLFPVVTTVLNGSSIAVLWIGAGRVGEHTLQIGALIAFLTYLTQILMAVMMATFIAILAPRATVCAERIIEVLDTDSSIVTSPTARRDLPRLGRVELRGVGFGYPGAAEPVLTDISLVAERGQTTAIIGSTGSGKTTLANLIPRLLDATSGAVLVDGADVRDVEPEALWSRMGLVPQRPFLFSGSVATNLRFSKPDATDDELWEALTIAQASRLRRRDAGRARRTDLAGRHERVGRPATAARHRPGAGTQAEHPTVRRLVLGARPRHRRPAPRRAGARTPPTPPSFIVAQRVSTIISRRPDPGARGRPHRGPRPHDDLLESCPTYREIVDSQLRRRGGGVSDDDATASSTTPRPSAAPLRRRPLLRPACPPRSPKDFSGTLKRLVRRHGPRPRRGASWCWSSGSRRRAARGHRPRRSSATPPTPSSTGRLQPEGHRLRRRCATSCSRAVALFAGSAALMWAQSYLLAGVVQRSMQRLRTEVEDKLNRLPLSLRRPQPRGDLLSRVTNDIDNLAPEPAAVDEPGAHLGVHDRRRAGGDDAHRSRRCSASSPCSRSRRRCSIVRSSPADPRSGSWPSGATPATSTPRSRRPSPATRSSRCSAAGTTSSRRFADKNDELYDASFRAQFIAGLIQPRDDVPRQPELRGDRRDRRPAGRRRAR